ncbi:MAG: hypothetical protein RL313_547, partial [Actinomycetota bacterium]
LKVSAVVTTLSNGAEKLKANCIKVAPGSEAAAISALDVTEKSVILVGERASESAGSISAAVALADKSAPSLHGFHVAQESAVLLKPEHFQLFFQAVVQLQMRQHVSILQPYGVFHHSQVKLVAQLLRLLKPLKMVHSIAL